MSQIKWGILGAGRIVRRWIGGARAAGIDIVAIGSRTLESAARAAAELGIPRSGSYESVLDDPSIDAVYVAVPHQAHKDLALAALQRGKHVLVEKPACVNLSEWEALTDAARQNGCFLMEAVWTRCFPAVKEIMRMTESCELGRLRHVQSVFATSSGVPNGSRLFDPAQAGGGLLDVGVYCLHLNDLLFGGSPEALSSFAAINSYGRTLNIDEQAVVIGRYADGALSEAAFGVLVTLGCSIRITYERGAVEINRFFSPDRFDLIHFNGSKQERSEVLFPVPQPEVGRNEGFSYEIEEMERCISLGLSESPDVPWESTSRVLSVCDSLRRDWGLRYPFE